MSRLAVRLARSLATKAGPSATPVDPHPFLSQINVGGGAHAGPFPIGRLDRDTTTRRAEKEWRQMKSSEKVNEAATQFSSLLVVAFGAGLAGLVIYATGTELFATNSPTRIFEDCVERIRESSELQSLLLPPLSFHGQNNSSSRIRRNRRVSSTLSTDSLGRETMHVRFWVEGARPDTDEEESYMDMAKRFIGPIIWEDSTKPGSYVPRKEPKEEAPVELPPPQSWGSWVGGGVASLFGGILPTSRDGADGKKTVQPSMFKRVMRPKPGEHWTGECVAELKKDEATGNFVYTQLYVDIPDSRAPLAYRVKVPTGVIGPATILPSTFRFWNRTTTAA